jgi:hypothetical protein
LKLAKSGTVEMALLWSNALVIFKIFLLLFELDKSSLDGKKLA